MFSQVGDADTDLRARTQTHKCVQVIKVLGDTDGTGGGAKEETEALHVLSCCIQGRCGPGEVTWWVQMSPFVVVEDASLLEPSRTSRISESLAKEKTNTQIILFRTAVLAQCTWQ